MSSVSCEGFLTLSTILLHCLTTWDSAEEAFETCFGTDLRACCSYFQIYFKFYETSHIKILGNSALWPEFFNSSQSKEKQVIFFSVYLSFIALNIFLYISSVCKYFHLFLPHFPGSCSSYTCLSNSHLFKYARHLISFFV